jgi:GT2 family glycosyltransferase
MKNTVNTSVVIVTWNNKEDIYECINSIKNQTLQHINIIVVDNNSSDNTLDIIRRNFEDVIIIALDQNKFLTKSNNIGINYVINHFKSDYVLVLNPDTRLESNVIKNLVSKLEENPKLGAVGPMLKFWKSEKEGLINSAGLIYDGFMQAYDRGFMEKDEKQYTKDEIVFGVCGACILYRVKALRMVGLYWDPIKMYLDEIELFIRLKKAGWLVLFSPSSIVWHAHMRSTMKNSEFKINKQRSKAWLLIALRHYTLKSKLAMIFKYLKLKIQPL